MYRDSALPEHNSDHCIFRVGLMRIRLFTTGVFRLTAFGFPFASMSLRISKRGKARDSDGNRVE
jgi:hypothetical protein